MTKVRVTNPQSDFDRQLRADGFWPVRYAKFLGETMALRKTTKRKKAVLMPKQVLPTYEITDGHLRTWMKWLKEKSNGAGWGPTTNGKEYSDLEHAYENAACAFKNVIVQRVTEREGLNDV